MVWKYGREWKKMEVENDSNRKVEERGKDEREENEAARKRRMRKGGRC